MDSRIGCKSRLALYPSEMRRFTRVGVTALLALVVAGCELVGATVPDRLPSEADAVRTALAVVDLRPPVRVELVEAGKARDIYRGAHPSIVSEEAGREWQRKLDRDAWRVDLIGGLAYPHPQCPHVEILDATAQLILDRETGEVLISVYGQPPCPGT